MYSHNHARGLKIDFYAWNENKKGWLTIIIKPLPVVGQPHTHLYEKMYLKKWHLGKSSFQEMHHLSIDNFGKVVSHDVVRQ